MIVSGILADLIDSESNVYLETVILCYFSLNLRQMFQ